MELDLEQLELKLTRPSKELPDAGQLLFYHNLKDRELWLDDEVCWGTVAFIINYIEWLNKHEADDKTPITLHIFSNGGSLASMFSLYSTLRNSSIPIRTINEGLCASAAFIIFLAGDERIMKPYAHFVAHEGSAELGGTARETRAAMKQYEIDVDHMANIIAERTNVNKEFVKEKYDSQSDWYINKEDAIKHGIITEDTICLKS